MLKNAEENTLYIIDGYGFIFRAFYAVPNLTTAEGQPIGAVYGFFKMLISLINTARPSHMVIALDTGKRTFRNDIYDDFIEKKTLKNFFTIPEYYSSFLKKNLDFNDIVKCSSVELVALLNIDRQRLMNVCNQYGFDALKPPKLLVILIFLNILDKVTIEECKTQYKANRRATPDELKSQFKIIRDLIAAMNIRTESVVGFEADDVIGSLAKEAVQSGYRSVIVSGDKDLCQMVRDGEISVYDPMKKVFLNEDGVFKKFGVHADQVCDYLSIVGDHCDNIFGINGIGPKGACKLLCKYGHIYNILDNLSELDDKTRQKIVEGEEILRLAYELVKLRCDAISVDDFEKYRLNINHEELGKFIKQYNFSNIELSKKHSHDNRKTCEINHYKKEDAFQEHKISENETTLTKKQGNLF